MYSRPQQTEYKGNAEEIIKNLKESKLEVEVSSTVGITKSNIAELVAAAKQADFPIIFTVTPGPAKDLKDLPNTWMDVDAAKGCTPQLNAFQNKFNELDAIIYAMNKHKSSYHAGKDGLLDKKGFTNLLMISDANNEIEDNLKLVSFTLEGKKFLERCSVVIKPNGEAKLFSLSSPVNDMKAAEHIEAIKNFIAPNVVNELQAVVRNNI